MKVDALPGMPRPVVAVINDHADTVQLLMSVLGGAGFAPVGYPLAAGVEAFDLKAFVHRNRPDAVVYQVDPPFARNMTVFRELRQNFFPLIPVVLTSTDSGGLKTAVPPEEQLIVLVKPYDPFLLVHAVREAIERTGRVA